MIPTPIGAVVIVLGLWLLFRPAAEMLVFVLACSLFAGASALDAPALGHSSIPPAMVALGFLALRCLRRDLRRGPFISRGVRSNSVLVFFCSYCALTSLVLPRIFAGRLIVIPMQQSFGYTSLTPSSQNLTQALYLLGTASAAVLTSAVVVRPGAVNLMVRSLIVLTWVQVATGLVDVVASMLHFNDVFAIFRTGAYAQLDQDASGFHRIAGLTPEASAYAALSFAFFVFNSEMWLRHVSSRFTGAASIAMLLLLLASTSSTAYASVGVYAVVLLLRTIVFPGSMPAAKLITVLGLSGAAFAAFAVTALMHPQLASSLSGTVSEMTLHKGQSMSGLERGQWAKQGWELFKQTRGLGVGVGSFRSSSIFTAILGAVGPACVLLILIYAFQALKPFRRSSYQASSLKDFNVAAAAGWASVMQLVPASLSSPGADPGLLFAILAACSISLRPSILHSGNRRVPASLEIGAGLASGEAAS